MLGWLSKGKMDVQLPKKQYSSGEMIKGTLVFSIKTNQISKKTNVRIYAEERSTLGSGKNQKTRINTIYDFTLPLQQSTELIAGQKYEVPFEIGIPKNSKIQTSAHKNPLINSLILFFLKISKKRYSSIKWYVKGRVDLQEFDITQKRQITVI